MSATSAGIECKTEARATHGVCCGADGDSRKWLVSAEIESLSTLPVLKSDVLAGWFDRGRYIWQGGDSDSGDEMVSSWEIALPCRESV